MSRRQRGVALLLVLWALAMLGLLLGALVMVVRQETRLALWQREHTQALLAAEAGIELAVRAISDPAQRALWVADGREQPLLFDRARLRVSVRSERGKLDLNSAAPGDFARVAQALGSSPQQASTLAQSLNTRRAAGRAPFQALEELRQLPGITAALYQQLLPELTLFSGLESPEPAFASAGLRRVLGLPSLPARGIDPGPVLSISSTAQLPDGFSVTIHSTVLLSINEGVRPYKVLRYSE